MGGNHYLIVVLKQVLRTVLGAVCRCKKATGSGRAGTASVLSDKCSQRQESQAKGRPQEEQKGSYSHTVVGEPLAKRAAGSCSPWRVLPQAEEAGFGSTQPLAPCAPSLPAAVLGMQGGPGLMSSAPCLPLLSGW